MVKFKKKLMAGLVATGLSIPMAAMATNGMNLEGYGPVSLGMGGASMAFDNGSAAVMNNPATIGLMNDGASRLDVAVGNLGPDVDTSAGPMTASSGGDSYYMPAIGWVERSGQYAYGVGLFAQGGMGTEYAADTFMGAGTGQDARSEVGVGRLIFPIVNNVNSKLTLGASFDYVWGGMDLKMPMPIGTGQVGTFSDFLPGFGGSQVLGEATVTPGLAGQIAAAVGAGYDTVAINFSNGSDFSQKASGTGVAGKLGLVYKVSNEMTVGATYHTKTRMSNWKGDASMVLYDTDGPNPDSAVPGSITIQNFEWPATVAAGLAYTPNDRWLIAADVKVIQWKDVMKNFTMEFTPGGGELASITFYQDWDDQTVVNIGAAYKVNQQFTVRAGANMSSNPIPDSYVHPLFPAIVENHYTVGFGYDMQGAGEINFALSHAPEVDVTNSNTMMKITHSQTSWQLMYTHNF